ncbi:MAG TPA: NADH-ubiquinone oxidoreductase-F iron-sulfur binding region domain-containing protein [Phycisphaerae bacterium]|nr:NADH-ubiquinone oxidoreductase-F iron-sulfur binding region domain-containing protein [Phycisphaerae bacterium]HNU44634.1 NADH-ubiquinone oxidoreductase-F iron-sulfur binding region domain-containing protein [Phycisphaerae bacterium]
MERLCSIEELKRLRALLVRDVDDRRPRIVVCAGTACQASGANSLLRAVKKYLIEANLVEKVALRITGCHGFCEMGPFLLTEPQNAFYARVALEDVPRLVQAVLADAYVEDLLYRDPVTGEKFRRCDDIPFFKNQQRTLLEMNRKIDPIRVYDYITHGGYQALEEVLSRRNREWVVEEVKRSALRGRGGAGFPTGLKWEMLARQPKDRGKFLVCNADEGDPGAYMDRSILEGNPHSIIEGMLIGAFGVSATQGVVYVRNEYPLAIKHLTIALRQAHDLGLLGNDILGTGFAFDIKIVRGAGAFVCGEETALIRSIEGKMGEPRQRPPFPVQKGINGKPTAINNVETWANVPLLFRMGAAKFAEMGTKGNGGCKVFSLVGKIKNTGLVEVPMGTTLGEVVHNIGGGPPGKAKIKAVQTGGPSGGCIPASRFDLPIDYDSLAQAGSIMGSGGMIVMDENTCMVDVAKYFMNFLKDESCGKCFTCRKGTQRMYEILDDISKGQATLEHLDLLEELALAVKDTTMCGLGQTASNPVLSTLRYFREEYEEHVYEKKCRAFVCKDLVGAPCQAACPIDTEAWRYVAHVARGEYEQAYQAIREANPFPSVCGRVCSHPCESRCRSGTAGKQPIAIRALKRFVTDRVDPSVYRPRRTKAVQPGGPRVAIIGSGPAGLTAAHYLSLAGYASTVFEADAQPGGMLVSGIPAYRLPRDTLGKEIKSLLDENVTLKCNTALGRDITIDELLNDGYRAVFLAIGAHKSRALNLKGEDVPGVFPAIEFLKSFNLRGQKQARGRVGVIGGGDSAVDAAGVALRQEGVDSVTIFYRRTRDEMPAQKKDIDSVLEEGVKLETLMTPVRILTDKGRLAGIECVRNRLGEVDAGGRRKPVPIPGTEHVFLLDTLIVTIGDVPAIEFMNSMGIEVTDWGTVKMDPATLATSRAGVFAGGDVVTGPNTVVQAIAAGKKAATMIGRYLRGEDLKQPGVPLLPEVYVEPVQLDDDALAEANRVEPPVVAPAARRRDFNEVELSLSVEDATREARRCLRCDLEFTQPKEDAVPAQATAGVTA